MQPQCTHNPSAEKRIDKKKYFSVLPEEGKYFKHEMSNLFFTININITDFIFKLFLLRVSLFTPTLLIIIV